ncbi:ankyrin, partial [Anaeromyces robustus]
VQYLINHGLDINKENDCGYTPLYGACIYKRLNILSYYFIKHGEDINKVNEDGETLLHFACERGNYDIVKYLIENGAKIDVENYYGKTPLF